MLKVKWRFPLCAVYNATVQFTGIRFNCNRASISRLNRGLYQRMYPTMIVLPDGATISVRYQEPRRIIKLPLDLSKLTSEQLAARQKRKTPKRIAVVEEEDDVQFDSNKYRKFWKN
ncbi:hypothetical protein CHS0354_022392 [Potamilus streckersoni]|uniref:Ribosomal protein L55 n=1 Tax=Potamilus streckersoni TaxID=2493646 RepID=A0AAE0SX33_9BIVA|nr:hypothetical protein CHS0354_022392 [Potamilus streckersoni]